MAMCSRFRLTMRWSVWIIVTTVAGSRHSEIQKIDLSCLEVELIDDLLMWGVVVMGADLKWFDVHFSLNGFMKIEAGDEESAGEIVEEILDERIEELESIILTGLGIEVYEIIEEEG